MVCSPPQPPYVVGIQSLIPANEQKPHEVDMPIAKVPVKPVGFLEIIKMAKPVHNLAESVFKAF